MKAIEKTFILGMKKEVNVESFVKWISLPVGHFLCPQFREGPRYHSDVGTESPRRMPGLVEKKSLILKRKINS